MTVQPGFSLTRLETRKTGFVVMRLILFFQVNPLDASAPAKRGKERENPKIKKHSPLKKVGNPLYMTNLGNHYAEERVCNS